MYKLDLDTLQWTEVETTGDQPVKSLTVDLSAWMRELCAALEDSVLVPHNQDQHSPGTHDTLMDVDGQMSSISLM